MQSHYTLSFSYFNTASPYGDMNGQERGTVSSIQKGILIYPQYRTVPYRALPFSDRTFFTLAVSKREAYRFFCLKITVFPLKNVKSANRTVFQNKDHFSVLIDLFQKREPFRDYFKTNHF
jgi:hypothetical protein